MWPDRSISCSALERTGAVAHLSKLRLFLQGMIGELRWRHGEVERLGIIEPRIAERLSRRS